MKRITLNIPDDYADVLTVTCIGGRNYNMTNVIVDAFDLTNITDNGEFNIIVKAVNGNESCV